MKVMVIGKATKDTEAGVMPTEQGLADMMAYSEKLAKAGIVLGGNGLKPTKEAKRVVFTGKKPSVVDGPFTETKELIAGYQLWQVKDMQEAVEWVMRAPMLEDCEVDIRPLFEVEDFGDAATPALRKRKKRLTAKSAKLIKKNKTKKKK